MARTWSSSRTDSRSSSKGGKPWTRRAAAPNRAPSKQWATLSRSTRRGERMVSPSGSLLYAISVSRKRWIRSGVFSDLRMRVSRASKPKLGMGVRLPFSLMRRAWGRRITRLHDGIIIPRSPNARDLGHPIIFGLTGLGVWGLTASSFPGPPMRGTWGTHSFLGWSDRGASFWETGLKMAEMGGNRLRMALLLPRHLQWRLCNRERFIAPCGVLTL